MAKEKKIGLYLGVNSVGAAIVQGKDIASLGRFEFSSLEEAKDKLMNENVRWEALINKTLREVSSDVKDIYISLADRDFIFRPLDMPSMKKKEIESSLAYEIEKYIPFKMEELAWDYDYVNFSRERKISLSFIGIKEGNFQRIKTVLSRLELEAVTIEPSCISLVRIIKSLKQFSQFKNFALLDFTQLEAYLTFFQQNLPVFNRYLVVPKKENILDLDNFIEAVNFSFQYFKREFKNYELEKFIIVGDSNIENLILPLKEGLQIDIIPVSPYDLTNRNNARVESVKALGVVCPERSSYKFRPNLRMTDERPLSSVASLTGVSLRVGLLSTWVGVGLIGSIFLSLILGNEILEKRSILKKKEESISALTPLGAFSWPERAIMVNAEEEKINYLKEVLSSFTRLSSFFKRLATEEILPHSLWLIDLNIQGQEEKYSGTLSGHVFRDNDYEERLRVDEFIANLGKDEIIESIFSKIELESSDRIEIEGFKVTRFVIILDE